MSNDQHTQSGNFRQMTPDELEANGYPRDFHAQIPAGDDSHRFAMPAARRAGKTSRINELRATAKRKPWILPTGIALLALLLGISIGAAQPPKTVEVTKEVQVDKPYPVEKRVEVRVTPKECVAALGYAQDVITSAGTTIGVLSDGLKAASRLDAAGVQAMSPKVDAQTEVIRGLTPKFQSNRDSCLASAK